MLRAGTKVVARGFKLKPEEVTLMDKEKRAISKKRMGAFVVGMIVIVLLALGYYYSEGQETGANTVIVAVRGYLSVEQKEALAEQFTSYAPQANELPVSLQVFEFPAANNGENSSDTSKMFLRLKDEIQTGQSDLLLLDSYVFDMLGDERLFEDLSVKYPNDPAVSGKYLYAIAGKPFASTAGLKDLPEVYLALRNAQSGIVNKNSQTLEKHSFYAKLLDDIVFRTLPAASAVKSSQK
ncbi:hypothetical protein V6615_07945 [Oscillospiraceae bacterium PP1C4]